MNDQIVNALQEVPYGGRLRNIYQITFADNKKKKKLILYFSRQKMETLCNYLIQFLVSQTAVRLSTVQSQRSCTIWSQRSLINFGINVCHGLILIYRKQANDVLECLMKLMEMPLYGVLTDNEVVSSQLSEYDRSSDITDADSVMDSLYLSNLTLENNPNVVSDVREITLSDEEDLSLRCHLKDEQCFVANPDFIREFCDNDEEHFQRLMKELEKGLGTQNLPGKSTDYEMLQPKQPEIQVIITPSEVVHDQQDQPEQPEIEISEQSKIIQDQQSQLDFPFKVPLPPAMLYSDISGDENLSSYISAQPKRRRRGPKKQVRPKLNKRISKRKHLLKKHSNDPLWKTKKPNKQKKQMEQMPSSEVFVDKPVILPTPEFEELVEVLEDPEDYELGDRPPMSYGMQTAYLRAEILRRIILLQGIGEEQEIMDLPMVPFSESLLGRIPTAEPALERIQLSPLPQMTGATGSQISDPYAYSRTHSGLALDLGVDTGSSLKQRIQPSLMHGLEELPLLQIDSVPQLEIIEEPRITEEPLSPRRLRPRRDDPRNYSDESPTYRPRPRRRRRLNAREPDEADQPLMPQDHQIGDQFLFDQEMGDQYLPFQEIIQASTTGTSKLTASGLLSILQNMQGRIRFTDLCPRGSNRLTAVSVFNLLIKMSNDRLVDITQKDSTGDPDKIFISLL